MKELTKPKKKGPKPRLVTLKLLQEVERLAARGLSQKQLCHALGFSESWWHDQKHRSPELQESYEKGATKGVLEIADALFEAARSGNTTAQLFYLKCRSPAQWIDNQNSTNIQVNLHRLSDTQLLDELRQDPVIVKSLKHAIPQLED